jgi:hypothetical protein
MESELASLFARFLTLLRAHISPVSAARQINLSKKPALACAPLRHQEVSVL